MNTALILSGGRGARFGDEIPKQYHKLCGQEVIAYVIDAVKNVADEVVIVCDSEYIERLSEIYGVVCTSGGNTRNESIRKGLDFIKANYDCEKVFINDSARPFATDKITRLFFDYLDEYDAVFAAQYITDSLGKIGEPVTDRSQYYLIQAPEAFRFDVIYQHFKADSPITGTVQQIPFDSNIKKYFELKNNLKITYREDFYIAEAIFKSRNEITV